jgi:hypothetical protein
MEAKQQRHHVVLVSDRLFIDGEQYIPPEDRPVNFDNVWNSPMIVRGFSLAVLFTAYKTTLVW